MRIETFALFPTRLISVQFDGTDTTNAEVASFLSQKAADDFNMHPDALNLLRLADQCPAIGRLAGLFREGLLAWLKCENAASPSGVDVVLFSNYAHHGEFTVVHNHNADVVAVYYAQVPDHARPPVFLPSPDCDDDYFAQEDGALLLHDPRFNANLAGAGQRDYVKVFPRPGLMVLFPGYLWHSVTPHRGERPRLAISANFRLRWPEKDNAETWALA
jgi:hypothetical protein